VSQFELSFSRAGMGATMVEATIPKWKGRPKPPLMLLRDASRGCFTSRTTLAVQYLTDPALVDAKVRGNVVLISASPTHKPNGYSVGLGQSWLSFHHFPSPTMEPLT